MSQSYQYYACSSNWFNTYPEADARGLTTWNTNNYYSSYSIIPNGSVNLTFTCTVPKCYSYYPSPAYGQDSCNVVFNAYVINGNTSSQATLRLTCSSPGNNPVYSDVHLSGQANHGATQAFDLAPTNAYNDTAMNTFRFTNKSDATIKIDSVRIYRTYKLCNLNACTGGSCPTYWAGTINSIVCHGGSITGTNGTFDPPIDQPCNCAACGGVNIEEILDTTNINSTIGANGGAVSWNFELDSLGSNYENYIAGSVCLFNFNGINTTSADTNTNHDVKLDAYLNGTSITTFYLNRNYIVYPGPPASTFSSRIFPSYDLAQSSAYHDLGANTVTLVNNGSVPVQMSNDGINIYRFYQVGPVANCTPCTSGCEIQCEACNTSCVNCQTTCEIQCEGCDVSCYEGCQSSCQFTCVTCDAGCQTACDPSCQTSCDTCDMDCVATCYMSCYEGVY